MQSVLSKDTGELFEMKKLTLTLTYIRLTAALSVTIIVVNYLNNKLVDHSPQLKRKETRPLTAIVLTDSINMPGIQIRSK